MTTKAAAREGGPLLLADDVRGTKTDLAVVSAAGGPRETLAKRRYPIGAYPGLAEMAKAFLGDAGFRVWALCVDVAGPVIDGQARLTNLDRRLDERSLEAQLGIVRAWLIKDLVATAIAVPTSARTRSCRVKEGKARPEDPIAVLAPGTGLGEAFLARQGAVIPGAPTAYALHQSEGCHAAFAPTGELEIDPLRTLWKRLRLAGMDDRTGPIVQAAVCAGPDPLARATATLFLRILGGEAVNLALKVVATGGAYLAGGIPQALHAELGNGPFVDAFVRAGRRSPPLKHIPGFVAKG